LTTRKHGTTGDAGGGSRPRIQSSHERVLDAGAAKAKSKARRKLVRGPARAALGERARPDAHADRGKSLRKARPAHEGPPPDRGGGWSVATESARQTATAIAMAALDKKAVALEILDVAGKVDYADFLVVMTGRSDRHTQALAQGIEEALRKKGVRPVALEGLHHGAWVLMDFGDVVVHVFQDEARQLYDIEGLWLDARRLPVPAETAPPVD
jgi:ribosome-associated protein